MCITLKCLHITAQFYEINEDKLLFILELLCYSMTNEGLFGVTETNQGSNHFIISIIIIFIRTWSHNTNSNKKKKEKNK